MPEAVRAEPESTAGGKVMGEDTRKLLKLFGVAVTDAEAEAEKLAAAAARLSAGSTREEVAALLQDASDLFREVNARWLEVTQRVFEVQGRLQAQLVQAASALRATAGGT
jgi:hypothetical protein